MLLTVPALASTAIDAAPVLVPIAPTADAELFRLARALRAAVKAETAAENAVAGLEHRLAGPLPARPGRLYMNDEEEAAFLAMTVGEMREGKYPRLYDKFMERSRARDAEAEASRVEFFKILDENEELKSLRLASGKAYTRRRRIAEQFFEMRAQTIDGILTKISLAGEYEWNGSSIERELAKDLRALKKAGVILARGAA